MDFKYTYNLGRKCKHCSAPIADQTHAATEYCSRMVLEDGSVKSCKDDYNVQQRKKLNPVFNSILYHHKFTRDRIEALLNTKGDLITMEDVNKAGIKLCRPLEFYVEADRVIYYFLDFSVTELTNNLLKIEKHERLF